MRAPPAHDPAAAIPVQPQEWRLRLLGRFGLTSAGAHSLGNAGQRLLALLAVHAGALPRWQTAQLLYPDAADAHASSNLRAVLWRLQRGCPTVVQPAAAEIRLAADVTVDYWAAARTARRLIAGPAAFGADELTPVLQLSLLHDLLPGWPDPWLVPERERFHQLRLHALEALCARLTSCGRHGAAVDVGLAVVGADPLRESAQRALIDAYLAEGNPSEAIRQYNAFRSLLRSELGLQPTSALRNRLAASIGQGDSAHRDRKSAHRPGGQARSSTGASPRSS